MSVNPQAHHFSDIMESIRLRLVSGLGLDDMYVRSVASDQYKYDFEADMVALRPLGPNPFTDAGGGRYSRPLSRMIRCYVSKRSSLDFVGDDRIVLADLLDYEDSIYDLLDDWTPLDVTGLIPLTIEPLHPIDSSGGPPLREADNSVGEVYSVLSFETVYVQPNSRTLP